MLTETDRAEALGFHAVWCAEHHFYDYGGHIPSVPVLGAAIAQRTKRLRIGSGIALAPLQDPIRLAERVRHARLPFRWASLTSASVGVQKGEYDAFERNMADSRVLFEEAHEIIIKAWTQERFFACREIPHGAKSAGHSQAPAKAATGLCRRDLYPRLVRMDRSHGVLLDGRAVMPRQSPRSSPATSRSSTMRESRTATLPRRRC